MAKRFLTWIFFLIIAQTSAQPSPCDNRETDEEQDQLQLCYCYSNLFGYSVERIKYPKLFEAVSGWLGTSYCYAGDTKNGVDCSGFVTALYKTAFDKNLEGSSKDIYKDVKPLKKSQLKEGDMVFFRIKSKKVSHVGVYLGQNKFAHASVHEGVVISDLEDPYYRKYFYKGGRVK